MAYATRVDGTGRIRLDEVDPAADGGLTEREADERLAPLTAELRELQELVYAAESHGLLIVLQGMDAAGKDVTIANVFAAANPQSCRVVEYKKAPAQVEERHDFLWRAHAPMPRRGELVIFDRSYYERVVTDRVTGAAAPDVVRRRYGHINAFEDLLADDGSTIILKFFLHVSRAEQGRRLVERERDAASAWKISGSDWVARESWDDFLAAYEDAINACAAPAAPWYLVPSDHQWFHNLAIAEALVERLRPCRDAWLAARDRRGEENLAEARQARGEG